MSASSYAFIRTKLSPPRVGRAPVPRLRILSMLEERRDSRLTLILGPAGSGKSFVGALWRQHLVLQGADVAWYNFSSDDDESQFVGYLATSFESSGLPIGPDALEIYNRHGGKSVDATLAALVNDMDGYAGPVYLVLEDFHYCTSPAIVAFLDRLLALAPPSFHLVISSRTRPPLALAPLRVKDQLTEIGFVDLRFTYEESVEFLRSRGVGSLTATQLRYLHDLTDGWVAGLQLAAYSLRKTDDPDRCLQRLAGSLAYGRENSFDNYLRETVAGHLDDEELDFLAKASACRRFNKELCEVITGNSRAGELLARFEADHLFVIPIESDDVTPWYRFHRIFSQFLNQKLLELPQGEVKKLNQLASHWFGGKGLYVEAVRHALHAGDEGFCLDLVERAARSTINGANFFLLLRWFEQLPREKTRTRLNLLLCVGWAQLTCGRLHDFEWTLQAIVAHPGVSKPGVQFEVELLQAYRLILKDDSEGALKLVVPYVIQRPKASALSLLLLSSIAGWGLVHANRFEEARDLVRERLHAIEPDRPLRPSPIADSVVGVSYLMQGDLPQAKRSLQRVIDDSTRSATMTAEVRRHLAGYLAEVHYQLDEVDAVEEILADFADSVDLVGPCDSVLFACRAEAHALHAKGQTEAAVRVLDKLEESARVRGVDRVVATCLGEKIHLDLARAQLPAARESLRQLQPLAQLYAYRGEGAFADIPWFAAVAEAEHSAATGQHRLAAERLEGLVGACERQGRLMRAAMLRVRLASSRMALGGVAEAALALGPALGYIRRYEMKRVLVDEGEAAQRMLRDPVLHAHLAAGAREDAQILLKSVRPPRPMAGEAAARSAPGGASLSSREMEILGLLAKALSTKGIARSLNLSGETVKWHLKNIYTKLGAASREDAVMKARSINLVA